MTGECQQTLIGHSSWISCVSITTDCKTVISGSNDKNVKLWNATGNEHARNLATPSDHIIHHVTHPTVAITTDRLWGLSGSKNDSLKLWDITSAKCVKSHSASISCIAAMHRSIQVATGSYNGDITLWTCDDSLEVQKTFKVHQGDVVSLKISKDDSFIVSASSDKTVVLYHVNGGHTDQLVGHLDAVMCVAFMQGDVSVISGSKDKTVKLWSLQTKSCERTFTGHTGGVGCLASTRNNKIIVSGSDQVKFTIRVWSTETGKCLRTIEGHHASIKCLGITDDDRFVFAGSHEGKDQLLMWDLSNGSCARKLIGHIHAVMSLKVLLRDSHLSGSSDGNKNHVLVTSSRDGTIKAWNIETGKIINSFDFQSQVKYFDAHPVDDGFSLMVATQAGTVSFLKLYYPKEETKTEESIPVVISDFQVNEGSSSVKEASTGGSCPSCQCHCPCQCQYCSLL